MQQSAVLAAFRRTSPRRPRTSRARREIISFHLFTLPWLLGFIFLTLSILLIGFGVSFTNYDGYNWGRFKFVGYDNYVRAFKDVDVLRSIKNTFMFALVSVPVSLLLAFLLAVLLNQPIKGRGVFRTLYYLPTIVPVTGAAWAWRLLLSKNIGLLNSFLSLFRPNTAINWLSDYWFLVMNLYTWWHVGGGMVIMLAGLQGIPQELYEAAHLDGASRAQVLRKITVPLMSPVLLFQLVMGIIGAIQIMDVALLFNGIVAEGGSGGIQGVPRERYFLLVYQYIQIFAFQRFGYGVALGWIFFLLILLLTVIVLWSAKHWVYYEAEAGRMA